MTHTRPYHYPGTRGMHTRITGLGAPHAYPPVVPHANLPQSGATDSPSALASPGVVRAPCRTRDLDCPPRWAIPLRRASTRLRAGALLAYVCKFSGAAPTRAAHAPPPPRPLSPLLGYTGPMTARGHRATPSSGCWRALTTHCVAWKPLWVQHTHDHGTHSDRVVLLACLHPPLVGPAISEKGCSATFRGLS